MKKLAIKGHATRGNEVLDLLKNLGGKKNQLNYKCLQPLNLYYIKDGCIKLIDCRKKDPSSAYFTNWEIYTLEKFEEKYPYKIGAKIKVPGFESESLINEMEWDGDEIQYGITIEGKTKWFNVNELNQVETKKVNNENKEKELKKEEKNN